MKLALKNPSSTIKEIGNPHAFGDVTVDNSSVTTAELNDTGSELTKATEINGVVDPTFEFLNLKGPKPATFEKVAYFFIKRYYYTLSKVPHKSYLFYHSKALLIHGDEAQDVLPVKGLKNIHEHLIKLDFSKCNIVLTNVDCTPSVNGSIFIVVIGEVAYFSGLQKKFIQSFLLKEKSNGFTIVNDIFRYIVDTADEYPSGDYVKLKVKEDTIKLDVEPTGSVPTSPTSESTVSPSASDEAPIAEDLPPVENLPPSVEEILPS
ncbi:NTF2-like protein, partial [Neoconidiobolus thromboides FSU 785]